MTRYRSERDLFVPMYMINYQVVIMPFNIIKW